MSDHFDWPDPARAILVDMWASGVSGSAIANRLSAEFGRVITRSAVMGRIHRWRLNRNGADKRKPPAKRERPARMVTKRKKRQPIPEACADAAAMEPVLAGDGRRYRVSIVQGGAEIRTGQCRYISTDPLADPHWAFCGRARTFGAYCGDHAGLTYQPSRSR